MLNIFLESFLALIAGILTIAAPCILLPLPIILGSSVGQNSKSRPLFITLGFVLTFTVLALALQFIVSHLGLNPNALRIGAVVLLALFALFMIWPTPFELFMARMNGFINKAGAASRNVGAGNLSGFLIGVIIGVIWAPCAGPILGSILTLVALKSNSGQASILLLAYAIGAGIPMLAIAYGGQAVTTKIKGIAKYATRLQQIFGVILLLVAASIYFQYDTLLQARLLNSFPNLGGKIEEKLNQSIKNPVTTFETERAGNLIVDMTDPNKTDKMKLRLKNYGPAPEFNGIFKWLNLSDNKESLNLSELKGKVVLIDFWTYSCINCIRTLPYITKWYDTYRDKGFVVIGVHTPEFAFEKETKNVQTAIKRHGIYYPVAQDNDFGTWNAYKNRYWPAHYLLDKNGDIVYVHFGEGAYDTTERVIQQLLEVDNTPTSNSILEETHRPQSPEMYFGSSRRENLSPAQKANSQDTTYQLPNELTLNTFAVSGQWRFGEEKAVCTQAPCSIKLHFSAKDLHMVAYSKEKVKLTLLLDGKTIPGIEISDSELYTLFKGLQSGEHIIEILIPTSGFEIFTFTFG